MKECSWQITSRNLFFKERKKKMSGRKGFLGRVPTKKKVVRSAHLGGLQGGGGEGVAGSDMEHLVVRKFSALRWHAV